MIKKLYCYTITVLLIVVVALEVGCVPRKTEYLATDRNQKWINDISYLQNTLPRCHKNLYFKVSEEEFIKQLEGLKIKVPSYRDEEIEIEMSKIIASMGDTHTGSSIGSETTYPFEIYWFDEGLYIVDTIKKYEQLINAKVLSINGIPMEDVAKLVRPILGDANDSWFKNQIKYYLTNPNILQYFGVAKDNQIELEVQQVTGETQTVKVPPVVYDTVVPIANMLKKEEKIPLYQKNPLDNYWYDYLEEEKIVYFNYRSCRQMKKLPFEVFNNEIWNFIEKHEVQKIVIDLRDNQGGRSPILNDFIKKLKRSKLNEEGKIYVVTGRATFSSAILNVLELEKETKAILIGEPTGGAPNHYGEVKKFELPNSKKMIRYSTKYFERVKDDCDAVEPDVKIGVSFKTYSEGVDPVLEWIRHAPYNKK